MSAVNDIVSSLILAQMNSGSGGKVKPLSVTENGTYNVSDAEKAEGYVGFAPVTVDVPQQGGGGVLSLQSIAALPSVASITFGDYEFSIRQLSVNELDKSEVTYPKDVPEGYDSIQSRMDVFCTKKFFSLLCKSNLPIAAELFSRNTNSLTYRMTTNNAVYVNYKTSSYSTFWSISHYMAKNNVTEWPVLSIYEQYATDYTWLNQNGETTKSETKNYSNGTSYSPFPSNSWYNNCIITNSDLSIDALIEIAEDVAEVFYNFCKN